MHLVIVLIDIYYHILLISVIFILAIKQSSLFYYCYFVIGTEVESG